jgi:hypothetical protein
MLPVAFDQLVVDALGVHTLHEFPGLAAPAA